MNHTVLGLRARRCPEESWLCQTGVAARDQWCAGGGRRCNGLGKMMMMNSKKGNGVLREGDCVYMAGVRCEVGGGRGGRFCDCWLQPSCSVRRGVPKVVRSGTPCAERMSRHPVGLGARA